MKQFWLCGVLLTCLTLSAVAQTNKKIKELQNKRGALQKEIVQSEQMLLSTKKDVRSQLNDLKVITGQIGARKKLITSIESDVKSLDRELVELKRQLAVLKRQLADRKKKYAASLKYMHKNRSVQEQLMFIFSGEDLVQTYRRMRYVQEYGNFQRRQADEITRKKTEVEAKHSEVQEVRTEKNGLLDLQTIEREKLEKQEQKQRTLVAGLQQKQKILQQELNRKRQQANRLNAQIDRLVEAEIAAAKKRAEAESRRRKNMAGKSKEKNKSDAAPMEAYKVDSDDRRLSASFAQNKGILPVPITGAYIVVEHYGRQNIAGLRHVELDNKGIDIKGKPGAQARAIFDGEVSAIFQYNGMTSILVRHGSYISVYCNLASSNVKRGQKVKTREVLGKVASDGSGNIVLHFQLRKEAAKLNPEVWIKI